ncbi:hypothetical protein STSP2_02507 [Anaerohalosphaera lusitana]|uniref:Uncharacterized protein n=1 Tax=Anaerohalosphaera lusitana TaxID=1936003 RepID=A0A1U9NNK8_9BACT|nr:hypothetical protein [Anaerohalosphaera lusitana]AQT69318.1 hypothetical protein STSP2_02507 [Anaerohalosphaera lusitana]
MVRTIGFSILALALVGIVPSTVQAADDELGFDVTGGFFSKYVWRGQLITDDYVFQPDISVSYKGFTGGVWGNLELTDYSDNEGEFTEVDYYFDYSAATGIDGVGFSVGAIHYDFPSGGGIEGTTELYWGLDFDAPLDPYIVVYHDIDEVSGTYATAGVSKSFANFIEGIDMEVGASIGWGSSEYNEGYWGVSESGFNDLTVSAAWPTALGETGWTFTPSISYVTLVDNDLRDSDAFGTASDHFYTGLSLSTSF